MVVEPPPGEGGAGGHCERVVSFEAVVLGEPGPFDLIIVADHSASLAWSRDELARGLSDLLTDVKGRDVRVFVLTPTQYGESSAAARAPLTGESIVAWQDPVSGDAYSSAVTTYSQACKDALGTAIECPDPLGSTPYSVEGTWSFSMPPPIAHVTPTLTDAEFDAQQAAVSEAILAISGTGSPQEMPLCTLARYVNQDPALLPENAVLLVISDEDDMSLPGDCLKGFRAALEVNVSESGSMPCYTSECDAYRYTVTGDTPRIGFPFECAMFDDLGNLIPDSTTEGWASQEPPPEGCAGIEAGPCTEAEEIRISSFCASGAVLTSCTRECVVSAQLCQVEVADASVNPCTGPFESGGVTYASLDEFCAGRGTNWRDCRGGGVDFETRESKSRWVTPTALPTGSTASHVGTYVRSRADQAFPNGAYLFQAIVFDPRFSCELGEGQSYAENISAAVGNSDRVFSLCDSYAPALAGVWDFAQTLIQTEFGLTLEEDETVTAVVVKSDDGGERTLAPGQYRYDAEQAQLHVERTALSGTDATLRVEVTSDCRPLVR